MSSKLILTQIDYPASNVDQTVQFFERVLGQKLLFRAGPLAFMDLGSVRLYIRPAEHPEDLLKASILYLRTDAIDSAVTDLVRLGAKFHDRPKIVARMPEYILWMAFVIEPDGRLVGLMEERVPN